MEGSAKNTRMRFSGLGKDNQEEEFNNNEGGNQDNDTSDGGAIVSVVAAATVAAICSHERPQISLTKSKKQDNKGERDYDTTDGEIVSVVAAATFAGISSHGQRTSSSKSKRLDINGDPSRVSRSLSVEEANAHKQSLGDASIEKLEIGDQRIPERAAEDLMKMERTANAAPIIKRNPTFADAYMGSTNLRKEAIGVKQRPAPLPIEIVTIEIVEDNHRKGTSRETGDKESTAEKWKNVEMARIKLRYEKVKSVILSWEEDKKAKARRRLEKRERNIERKRARSIQEYRNDLLRIFQIAGRAIASTEEKRMDEESKVMRKAKKIRSTGKVPATCFCF